MTGLRGWRGVGLVVALAAWALAGRAEAQGVVFQSGFHQALHWSVATPGRATYRQKLPVGRAGSRVRVAVRAGTGPLTVYRVTVALAGTGGTLASAPVTLTFGGAQGAALGAGGRLLSDAVSFPVAFGSELYVSLDVEGAVAAGALMTFPDSFRYAGGNAAVTAPTGGTAWPRATGVDTVEVEGAPTRAFVAIGDSITEGYVDGDVFDYAGRTDDYREAWTAVAERWLRLPVLNAGVGNRRVQEALDTLEAEAMTVTGVTDCVVQVGTNDLAFLTAEELQARLEALYARLRPRCRVWAGTLLPKERTNDSDLATVNARRRAVNAWLRTQAQVAGVIDFEAALGKAEDPNRFQAGFNMDGVHPTVRGQAVMGREAADQLSGWVDPASPPVLTSADVERVLTFARSQLQRTAAALPATQSPKATRADGTWTTVLNTELPGWTQGFFPGLLWAAYEDTGDAAWRTRADAWTRALEVQKTNTTTHDLGFKMVPSFGEAYRITGDAYYRDVLLASAQSLASRYRASPGIIDCCDWNPDWQLPLVVDTMMNLELLLWAADNGGRPEWRQMALNHALRTQADLMRPDGSTFHVVDYDPATGAVRFKGQYQGDTAESTWTRGQAWAIYGFTMVYRYTRDARMLAAAQKAADSYLARVPMDGTPNWDFSAPQWSKDSSTSAAVASALLELSGFVGDTAKGERYRAAAVRTLATLAGPRFLAQGSTSWGVLLHAVGHYLANKEVDVSLIYGDYYFVEALRRFRGRVSTGTRVVIPLGSVWRYDDRGVDPGSGWTGLAYDDTAWPQGAAQLGYGDGDEATRLTRRSPTQPSVYFRKRFTVDGAVTAAQLRVVHDDGVAVWVNGVQVFGKYVGNGTGHAAWASTTSADNEVSTATLPTSAFRAGENVVAVVVKQVDAGSSDTSFDLSLTLTTTTTGPTPPAVTVTAPNGGEVLTVGTATQVRWSTQGSIGTVRVEWSANGGTTWSPLASAAPNTGAFSWTVPDVETTQGRVRVSDTASPASDVSDAAFTVRRAPPQTTFTAIPLRSVWRYDDTGVDRGTAWLAVGYDDGAWKSGAGQLGYGDGDEATVLVRTSPSRPSAYFRRKVTLTAPVTAAQLQMVFDDAVAVWVNGVQVFTRNMNNGTGYAAYAGTSSGDNATVTTPLSLATNPFVVGENVVAVMVKQSSGSSTDLSFDLQLTLTTGTGTPPPPETTATVIPLGSTWRFDDTGVDRGTAWRALAYDDAAWRSGAGQLGYGDGDEATLLRRTSPATPSAYFRRRFTVQGTVTGAQLRVLFDDAVAVWVNGTLVYSRNMNNGTGYAAYAGTSSGDNATVTTALATGAFVSGENVVAVMVKQSDSGSSDLSFDLQLTLTTRQP